MDAGKMPLESLLGLQRHYYYCKDCNKVVCSRYDRVTIECVRCEKQIPKNVPKQP